MKSFRHLQFFILLFFPAQLIYGQTSLPINFDSVGFTYVFTDFGGGSTSVATDPVSGANKVAKTNKPAGAQSWAGVTIGGTASTIGFNSSIPFASNATKVSVMVYSPDSGIVVKLKVEDATNNQISCEVDVKTKKANAWDTLVFDFANGTPTLNLSNSYKKMSIFFNFGVDGNTAGNKDYYFDEVMMLPPSAPVVSNVTFSVDMSKYGAVNGTVYVNGNFNSWCGSCNPMVKGTQDTNVWTVALPITNGPMEFKYTINGWNIDEKLTSGTSCTITAGGFTNRSYNVSSNVTLPTVCWESCVGCNTIVLAKVSLPIYFDSTNVDYSLADFGGNSSSIVADPSNANNKVVKVIKTASAADWAGTTIGNTGFASAIPFAANRNVIKMRVYSPAVGMKVKLKAEDVSDPTKSVETDTFTTVANTWETLTFNFANQSNGTAAINYGYSFKKLSAFFNFGVDGATAGEKIFYFDNIELAPPTPANVTFNVNMKKYGAVNGTVYVNGTFNSWCGSCNPMVKGTVDTNIWSVTLPINNGAMEYKFTINGWDIDEKLAAGSSCTVTSGGFTNRSYNVTSNVNLPVICWESCANCVIVNPNALNMPVSFESTTLNYGLTDFEGNASSIVADPLNSSNKACKVIKSNSAKPWAGTTIGGTIGFDNQIPFVASTDTKISMRVYSPNAGIKVRMKVEDPNDAGKSVETEATTTIANNWEVLVFDFANEANGTAKINYTYVYKKLTVFFNFGTDGATAGEKIYYFDDVTFGTLANTVSSKVKVKFTVDTKNLPMAPGDTITLNGTFNNWCGDCAKMTNLPGTKMWTTTVELDSNTEYEYKYVIGAWKSSENLSSSLTACTKTTGNFTNRLYKTGKTNDSIPMVCWESCSSCGNTGGPSKTYLTFRVDMSKNKPAAGDTVTLNGTFNNWCGACTPMTKVGTTDVWSATVLLNQDSSYDYKYVIGAWKSQETLKEGSVCTTTKSGFTNRTVVVNKLNDTLPIVCWESCVSCQNTAPKTKVTFKVNMKNYLDDSLAIKGVTLNGSFNGWCGNCTPMTLIGSNIYATTLTLDTGSYDFKFTVGNWLDQEQFSPSDPCTKTVGNFTNRNVVIKDTAALIVGTYCWNTCNKCEAVGSVTEAELNNVKVYPNPVSGALFVDLGQISEVGTKLYVYNMLGEQMNVKSNNVNPGTGTISLDTHGLKQGVYLLKIESDNVIKTIKFQVN
jgi:hypothetical protein